MSYPFFLFFLLVALRAMSFLVQPNFRSVFVARQTFNPSRDIQRRENDTRRLNYDDEGDCKFIKSSPIKPNVLLGAILYAIFPEEDLEPRSFVSSVSFSLLSPEIISKHETHPDTNLVI